jgi:hypothetical protein
VGERKGDRVKDWIAPALFIVGIAPWFFVIFVAPGAWFFFDANLMPPNMLQPAYVMLWLLMFAAWTFFCWSLGSAL